MDLAIAALEVSQIEERSLPKHVNIGATVAEQYRLGKTTGQITESTFHFLQRMMAAEPVADSVDLNAPRSTCVVAVDIESDSDDIDSTIDIADAANADSFHGDSDHGGYHSEHGVDAMDDDVSDDSDDMGDASAAHVDDPVSDSDDEIVQVSLS